MIRISMGPIRISTRSTDRWGRPETYWSVNPWGYVSLDRFGDLIYFESKPKQAELLWYGIRDNLDTDEDRMKAAIKDRLDRLKSQNTVYQFNAFANIYKPEYIRMCAVLFGDGDKNKLQAIPWFDAFVKYPVYSVICNIANKVNGLVCRFSKRKINI